ncbi:hypothetical protein WJX75_005474 [Coccomyxa subellipsoidea]|uniref:CAF1B/HIR1 beta-propeller domain-containing protein n=1 Tax=Coccomyxa subellipsoidea TaxID=248742 RepID=A0ABR2YL86_9CHLO
MRAKLLQVVWHSKEPVYSLDFHPSGLLATGGGDKEVKLGQDEAGDLNVTHEGSLGGHAKMVNCVRFSPSGGLLATAGDGGEVFLWKPSTGGHAAFGTEPGAPDPGWKQSVSLRGGHAEDVLDLAWAPDSSALLSGSIENVCVVWDVEKGKGQGRLTEHCHYVQGVAWDPARTYVVSQSADRTCRVYGPRVAALGKKGKQGVQSSLALAKDLLCQSIISKRQLPCGTNEGKPNKVAMFHDENMSFFRRLAWSPEGSMLVFPAGIHKTSPDDEGIDAAYVYARGRWNAPVLVLPATKPVMAVRFCPLLFELGEGLEGEGSPFELPYKMVLAVATSDSVMLYDTSGQAPFAVLGSLHPDRAPITDIAWSCDGRFLATSSMDGFCSVAEFAAGDLGTPLHADRTPPHIAALLKVSAKAMVPAALKAAPAATPIARTPAAQAQAGQQQPSAKPAATAQAAEATLAPKRALEVTPPAPGSAAAEEAPNRSAIKKPRRIAPTAVVATPAAPSGGVEDAGPSSAAPQPSAQLPVSASKPPVPPKQTASKPIHPFLQPRTGGAGPSLQQRLLLASSSGPPTSASANDDLAPTQQPAPGRAQPATSASFTSTSTVREAQRAEMRRIGLESPAPSMGQAASGLRPPTPRRIRAQLIGSASAQTSAAAGSDSMDSHDIALVVKAGPRRVEAQCVLSDDD